LGRADAAVGGWAGRVVVRRAAAGRGRELPRDLAALDRLLADRRLLAPIEQAWERAARGHGRPTIPMGSFVRLMVIKQRTGWGYETLVREVSDSLHLRRFCLLPLTQRVPDESTVRKLVRRLGPEVVAELTRVVIGKAQRETRFVTRAVRIDSTVVEADIRYPTDAGLAWQGARVLAREGGKLAGRLRSPTRRVVDRSRQLGRTVRAISRTLARRTNQRRAEVMKLNAKAGRTLARSVGEARALAAQARASARGRGAQGKLQAARRLEELADACQRISSQIRQRSQGEKIADRLVSLADPDARPIRKGKLGKPNEFGYVVQLAEVTANTRRGARGYLLPAASAPGNPGENRLLAQTMAELDRLGLRPREVALDGGFVPGPTEQSLAALAPVRTFISGRAEPGSRRTRRRLARYRTGCEGRISHLKRGYGLGRSRLRGDQGQRIWTGWAVLAYNLDTLANQTA
jgi:transposase, IS5 family